MKKQLYAIGGLLSLLFSLGTVSQLGAKNYKVISADISYQYIADSTYRVKLNIYTDCDGDPLDSVMIHVSSATGGLSPYDVPATIKDEGDVTMFGLDYPTRCTDSRSTMMGIKKWVATANVTLSNNALCQYTFSWKANNRDNAPNGDSSQAFYIRATMYACQYRGVSSPEFSQKPFFFMGNGQCYTKQNQVTDHYVDTLSVRHSFKLVSPLIDANTAYRYKSPFGYQAPFRYMGFQSSYTAGCSGFTLDSTNGSIRTMPRETSSAPTAIQVDKYVNGVLVSSVMRDIMYFVDNEGSDRPPIISGIDGSKQEADTFYIGQQGCFTIGTFDPDKNDTVEVVNASFPDNSADIRVEQGKKWPKINFCWTPGPNALNGSPYTFTVIVKDNWPTWEDYSVPAYAAKAYTIYIYDASGISQARQPLDLKIYPVLANDILRISGYTGAVQQLYAIDMQGKVISLPFDNEVNSNIAVNTSLLTPGLYQIQVVGKSGVARARCVILH